jgi:transposase-like protein
MTEDMMNLRMLMEKSSDADLLREMIGFASQRLMELEIESLTGAGHGERSADRINYRNGYRERDWETRAGTVSCVFRSCARAATTLAFSSRGAWRRKH